MRAKLIVTAITGMIIVGVVSGLVMGSTPGGIPEILSGIPSGYDTSAKMSDEVSAVVTKSDTVQGKIFSISLVEDAGTTDRP